MMLFWVLGESLSFLRRAILRVGMEEFEYLESQGRACLETAKKVLEVLSRIESELAKTSN
jgi:hypothetical protein